MDIKWTLMTAAALFLAAACGSLPDTTAGGSTDTETSMVAGVIESDSGPAAGAHVVIGDEWSGTAGNDGKFSIAVTYDPGNPPTYEIDVTWSLNGTDYTGNGQVTVNASSVNAGMIEVFAGAPAKR